MSLKGARFAIAALLVTVAGMLTACSKAEEKAAAAPPPPQSTKLPITTASEEARKEFLAGRDLAERLLATDSIQHFDKAIALDPKFASAELSRSNVAPTAQEFFDHLAKAVSLAGAASNGERLLILATEAGANNNPQKQLDYLQQLEAAYPNDERAHFNLGGYLLRSAGFPEGDRAVQEGGRAQRELLACLQHSRLRLSTEWRLRQRGAGVQEVHRVDSERSEPLRLLCGAAPEDGQVRSVDRAVSEGAGRRSELRELPLWHRGGPDVSGQAGGSGCRAREACREGAHRRRTPDRAVRRDRSGGGQRQDPGRHYPGRQTVHAGREDQGRAGDGWRSAAERPPARGIGKGGRGAGAVRTRPQDDGGLEPLAGQQGQRANGATSEPGPRVAREEGLSPARSPTPTSTSRASRAGRIQRRSGRRTGSSGGWRSNRRITTPRSPSWGKAISRIPRCSTGRVSPTKPRVTTRRPRTSAPRRAEFNSLPQINYALVRAKAKKLGDRIKT